MAIVSRAQPAKTEQPPPAAPAVGSPCWQEAAQCPPEKCIWCWAWQEILAQNPHLRKKRQVCQGAPTYSWSAPQEVAVMLPQAVCSFGSTDTCKHQWFPAGFGQQSLHDRGGKLSCWQKQVPGCVPWSNLGGDNFPMSKHRWWIPQHRIHCIPKSSLSLLPCWWTFTYVACKSLPYYREWLFRLLEFSAGCDALLLQVLLSCAVSEWPSQHTLQVGVLYL